MFTVKVLPQIITHCKAQVDAYNFGKRFTANGSKSQQLTGIIGQSVVMKLFGMDLIDGTSGFDNGVDLVFDDKKIDVKTMGRNTDVRVSYTNNFLKLQDYFSTQIYIFCSYNKIKFEVTICGWIDKNKFIKDRKFYPKGTIRTRFDKTTFTTFADLYEIDNQFLNDVNSIEDLKKQLKSFEL